MGFDWDDSRGAFAAAGVWFGQVTRLVGDRWDQSGLGEWDVRALVGHTSRSFLTVETYLARPADTIDCPTPADYYRAASAIATGPAVAERGREAGRALGVDPVAAVAEIAGRVMALVEAQTGNERLTTAAGGMVLSGYLPTRTFELVVHTCDLCVALDEPAAVPPTAASQTLRVLADLVVDTGRTAPVLRALTGRTPLPAGFTLL